VFWVISVQFDLRNTLPKLGLFLLGHPVYMEFLVKPEMLCRIYMDLRLATLKAVSFDLLHNVSTLYRCRVFYAVTVV